MRRFLDILDMPLTEQAASRKDAIATVRNIMDPLAEHVLKLLLIETEDGTRAHWKTECNAFIRSMTKRPLKNGGYLRASDYAILFNETFAPDSNGIKTIGDAIVQFKEDYNFVLKDIPLPDVLARLKAFYGSLCDALSRGDTDTARMLVAKL